MVELLPQGWHPDLHALGALSMVLKVTDERLQVVYGRLHGFEGELVVARSAENLDHGFFLVSDVEQLLQVGVFLPTETTQHENERGTYKSTKATLTWL